jgi:hypothetical protein
VKEERTEKFIPKSTGGDFLANPLKSKKPAEEKKDIVKLQKEKGQKDIEDGLSKLESVDPEDKETISSKMPLRTENQEIDDRKKIKIPRRKILKRVESASNVQAPSPSLKGRDIAGNKDIKNNIPKNLEEFQKASVTSSSGIIQPIESENFKEKSDDRIGGSFFEKPDFVKKPDILSKSKNVDSSIFDGKETLARRALSFKLRSGKGEIVKAQKEAGLKLDRQQMSELVNKYFPSYYGRDISKSEFAKQLKIMDKKPISDPSKRLQTKREINLLKKIGGVK